VPSEKSQNAEGLLAEDHEALGKLLHDLLAALGQADEPAALKRLDLFWARLAMHIRGEHLHLFPAILSAFDGDTSELADETPTVSEAREAIAQLHSDHDFFMHQLADAIKIMRDCRAAGGGDSTSAIESVRQIIATVRDRLEVHNKLEEDMVYRWPARLLEPAEQTALEVEIRGELKNLPPRFREEAG
jgi:iron-sulfur cluster repair protein YtfE (RIC family)